MQRNTNTNQHIKQAKNLLVCGQLARCDAIFSSNKQKKNSTNQI